MSVAYFCKTYLFDVRKQHIKENQKSAQQSEQSAQKSNAAAQSAKQALALPENEKSKTSITFNNVKFKQP